ncbi:MAG TPA: hypothetical protein VMJ10_10540 [Kofleriaceae bacterium]|nr:hypothetical protein [Kofleriaceae bacterium]
MWSPLERRVRRIARLVQVFALAAAVFGMLPGGVDVFHHSFKHDTDTFSHTMRAGGWSVVGWAITQVLAGTWVRDAPSAKAGIRWLAASIVIYVISVLCWLFETFTLSPVQLEWPAHATAACASAATLLVFVALPVVLLTADRSTVPRARVVSSE